MRHQGGHHHRELQHPDLPHGRYYEKWAYEDVNGSDQVFARSAYSLDIDEANNFQFFLLQAAYAAMAQDGTSDVSGRGLPLDSFTTSAPPGWRAGLPKYPIRRFTQLLRLW